jgi:hypothetical protein
MTLGNMRELGVGRLIGSCLKMHVENDLCRWPQDNVGREKMTTVRGHYRFTVKERSDGSPWIAAEPAGDIIPGMGDTTLEQAHDPATAMNNQISAVHISR